MSGVKTGVKRLTRDRTPTVENVNIPLLNRCFGGDWCLVVPLVFKTSVGFVRVPGGFDSHSPPPFSYDRVLLSAAKRLGKYDFAVPVLEGWLGSNEVSPRESEKWSNHRCG